MSNGVRTIVVETANRFARDLMVQEIGYAMLKERGVELIAADKPDAFLDNSPTARMIRQILGVVSEFEKAMLVSKLRGARERKRATGVKVEGRKSHQEKHPEVVALALELRKRGRKRSLREIAAELFKAGFGNKRGTPFSATSITRCWMAEGCPSCCRQEDRGARLPAAKRKRVGRIQGRRPVF